MSQHHQEDGLEEFIQANREAFDHLEPSPDLWKRVVEETPEDSTPTIPWTTYLWRAATVAALIVGSIAIWQSNSLGPQQLASVDSVPSIAPEANEAEAAIPAELAEAEAFYGSQVSLMKGELEHYSSNYPDLQEEASSDLAELDSAYSELKRDLKDDLANEEVVSALIQNYRLKLQVLETILKQIKKIENSQQEDDKNELSYM